MNKGLLNVVGAKRIMLLVILLGANVVLAAALYLYIVPELSSKKFSQRQLKNSVLGAEADISRLKREFDQIEEQKADFETLSRDGFFSDQTRKDVKKIFSVVQKRSKVVSAVVSVRPGLLIKNADAAKANHKILTSPVDIKIKAVEDGDVYNYLRMLLDYFPGHISVDRIKMSRVKDVDLTVLRAISSGLNPELIKAEIRLSWRTMIPDTDNNQQN